MVLQVVPRSRLSLGAALLVACAASLAPLSAPRPSQAQDGTRTYRVVSVAADDVLNIRSGPSAGYPIVGLIPPRGRGVLIIGGCDEWCRVNYDGVTGWVNGRYLAPESAGDDGEDVAPAPRAAPKQAHLLAYWRITGMAEGESLKVHAAPSAQASVVHAFEPESGCIRLASACRKPWCQVAFPGLSGDRLGWVDAKNLAPSQEACSR